MIFACCGHGNTEGYLKFEDGRHIEFMPIEVSLDLPSVRHMDAVPVYQLGGSRIFDFIDLKVKLRYFKKPRTQRRHFFMPRPPTPKKASPSG